MQPVTDTVVRLKDGRGVGVAEYGEPSGHPVFYFHGFPSCRLEPAISHVSAARKGIRLIALDRPGIGNSDPAPLVSLARSVNDVTACADAMGIDRFSVMGGSGGGPYALACARKWPERLAAAVVVSSFGRIAARGVTEGMRFENRVSFRTARRFPIVARVAMATMSRTVKKDPDSAIRQVAKAMGERDADTVLEPGTFGALRATLVESFRAGNTGQADDMLRLVRPWRFRVENIRMPVQLWHGTADRLVPEAMARDLAEAIPLCRAEFIPGEGHLLALNFEDQIFDRLLEAART
jgi:pimeloyl-ACP methyl ester carboxylesterase